MYFYLYVVYSLFMFHMYTTRVEEFICYSKRMTILNVMMLRNVTVATAATIDDPPVDVRILFALLISTVCDNSSRSHTHSRTLHIARSSRIQASMSRVARIYHLTILILMKCRSYANAIYSNADGRG